MYIVIIIVIILIAGLYFLLDKKIKSQLDVVKEMIDTGKTEVDPNKSSLAELVDANTLSISGIISKLGKDTGCCDKLDLTLMKTNAENIAKLTNDKTNTALVNENRDAIKLLQEKDVTILDTIKLL